MRLPSPLRQLVVPAALAAGLFALAPGAGGQPPAGGDKGTALKGEVRVGYHKVRLEAGKLYQVRVEGNGFAPQVAVRPGGFTQLGDVPRPPGGAAEWDLFEGIVAPRETRDYVLTVSPKTDDDLDGGRFTYTATVTPLAALLDKQDRTNRNDPRYQNGTVKVGPHKEYPVQFKARQVYVITLDMTQPGMGYDPYLVLEGPGGDVVASNDDGGQGLNSRIVYRARRGGEYRVIAAGLGDGVGGFHVRVITTAPTGGAEAPPAPEADPPRKGKE